jgi:hypothetical protein
MSIEELQRQLDELNTLSTRVQTQTENSYSAGTMSTEMAYTSTKIQDTRCNVRESTFAIFIAKGCVGFERARLLAYLVTTKMPLVCTMSSCFAASGICSRKKIGKRSMLSLSGCLTVVRFSGVT